MFSHSAPSTRSRLISMFQGNAASGHLCLSIVVLVLPSLRQVRRIGTGHKTKALLWKALPTELPTWVGGVRGFAALVFRISDLCCVGTTKHPSHYMHINPSTRGLQLCKSNAGYFAVPRQRHRLGKVRSYTVTRDSPDSSKFLPLTFAVREPYPSRLGTAAASKHMAIDIALAVRSAAFILSVLV